MHFTNVTFSGNGRNVEVGCPGCGLRFEGAPGGDGTFSTVGGRLQKVADYIASADRDTLDSLRSLIEQAREERDALAGERALAQMGVQIPTGGWRTPVSRNELWAILAVVIPVLIAVLGLLDRGEAPLTPSQVQQLIDANKDHESQTTGKVGRNETCPCGSGAKYKRCHGSPVGP